MSGRIRAVTRRLLWVTAGLAALIGTAAVAGARINTTRSFPVGLYWTTGAPPAVGALVLFCPPPAEAFAEALRRGYVNAGFCPGGYGYLIKKIVAGPGDRIAITGRGVWVNGEPVLRSAPLESDPSGRPLPHYRTAGYTLGGGEVLLLSDYHPRSFDGRYFGPMDRSRIRAVIRPVLTW